MFNKKIVPVVGILVLLAAMVAVGASQSRSVSIPPGELVESPNARVNANVQRPTVPDAPALPAASMQSVFSDDFSKSSLDGWQTVESAPGKWVAKDGRLVQGGDTDGDPADEDALFVVKDVVFTDGRLEAAIFPTSGSQVGLAFRGTDAGYYRVVLNRKNANETAKVVLQKVTTDGVKEVASAPVSTWAGFSSGEWQSVSVNAQDTHIVVAINGTTVIVASDSAYASGWAGIYSWADMGSQVDNVRIQQLAGR
ncbi:MAG: family 16 glycoside hydrolase [Chloroflexia bacterium]